MYRFALVAALAMLLAACGGAASTAPQGGQPAAAGQASPTAPSAAPAPPAPSAAGPQRVTGQVASSSGGAVTLRDGAHFTLNAKSRVIRIQSVTPADVQRGDYVAVTAKRQPDNTLLASVVNIFPEAMRGVGPGQRPMGGGNLMTNATVDQVQTDGFTVTFPGGGARVRYAPGVKVGRLLVAKASDIQPGVTVSALVSNGVALSVFVQ